MVSYKRFQNIVIWLVNFWYFGKLVAEDMWSLTRGVRRNRRFDCTCIYEKRAASGNLVRESKNLKKGIVYRDIWLSSDCASFCHRSVENLKYREFSVNIAERTRTWKHSFTIICSCRLFTCIVYTSSQTAPGQKNIDHRFLWTGFFLLQTCDWRERGHQNKSGLVHDRTINANDWNVNNKGWIEEQKFLEHWPS